MTHSTPSRPLSSTLSPSMAEDLRGAVAPRPSTWRESVAAAATSAVVAAGLGLVAAGWLKSRARHQ